MKLTITLDLNKIDKKRIIKREYTNKQGEIITCLDYKIDLMESKESKVIKEGDSWKLVKDHYVIESATKEEKEAKTKMNIVGDTIRFVSTDNGGDNYNVKERVANNFELQREKSEITKRVDAVKTGGYEGDGTQDYNHNASPEDMPW